jgi:hypothetical protein
MKALGIYRALGADFELHVSGRMAGLLGHALEDLRVAPNGPAQHRVEVRRAGLRRRWTVSSDGAQMVADADSSAALYAAIDAVTELGVAAAGVAHTVLHASGIEMEGSAGAFTGPSGSGKSTLTGAAALRGYPFIADEAVAIDDHGMALPFHRPIGLRANGAKLLGERLPRGPFALTYPWRVGEKAPLSKGAPLGLVVVLERHDGATSVEPMSPAMALLQLANQTLGAEGQERVMYRRLDSLVRRVPVVLLKFDDHDEALAATKAFLLTTRR